MKHFSPTHCMTVSFAMDCWLRLSGVCNDGIAEAFVTSRLGASARPRASLVKMWASCEAREIDTYAWRVLMRSGCIVLSMFTRTHSVVTPCALWLVTAFP